MFKYGMPTIFYAPNDGMGGATSQIPNSGQYPHGQDPNQQNQQQQSQQNNNNNGQNNGQDNDDDFQDLWNNESGNSHQQQGQNNNNNQQQNQQQQNNRSADEIFNEHVKSLPFDQQVDPQELSRQLQDGDFSGLQKMMRGASEAAYKAAMIDANKIIARKVDEAVEQAVEKATGATRAEAAIKQMNTALPFTADPAVAPIAEVLLDRLTKKGKSLDEAIDAVGAFANRMSKISQPDLRKHDPNRYKSAATDLNLGGDDDEGGNKPDWVGMLTGD